MKKQLYIGTCSWKYDSWAGLVYDENDATPLLEQYSKSFNTVEIDQWFWSLFQGSALKLPNVKDVESYVDSVPKDFLFTIKVPNSVTLTHYYKKAGGSGLEANPHFFSAELFEQFYIRIQRIIPQTAVLQLQFEYLNKQKISGVQEFIARAEKFLDEVTIRIGKQNSLGFEIRNPNFLNREYFEFLGRNSIIPVLMQGYYMNPIFDIYHKFSNFINGNVVVRLHGPERQEIEVKTGKIWNQIVEPKDQELNQLVEMIAAMMQKEITIFLNVNNHYEGSAPLTISKINKLLEVAGLLHPTKD